MPERPAAQLYAALERRVNGLRQVRQSGERALTAAVLRDRELNHLYESTFLNLVASFDAFQEELFYSSILGHSKIVTVRLILPFRSRAEATRFVEASERGPFRRGAEWETASSERNVSWLAVGHSRDSSEGTETQTSIKPLL